MVPLFYVEGMLSQLKSAASKVQPTINRPTTKFAILLVGFIAMTSPAAAAAGDSIPYEAIIQIFNIVVGLIIAIALVNGAVGLLQYMTAGSNVERSSAGKERIFKTFAALIGAAVLRGIVAAASSAIQSGAGTTGGAGEAIPGGGG